MYFHKVALIIFIYNIILEKVFSDDCSFPGLTFWKAKTLSNGYHLLVTHEGIFSFKPRLSKIAFSYTFTEEQKLEQSLETMKNTINQVEISQFSGDDGEEKNILCYANNYIYFLTPYGQVIFNQILENKIEVDYEINLIAYNYYNNEY